MDEQTAKALCALNTRFYAQQSTSFSSTRKAAWPGWLRCAGFFADKGSSSVEVLDVACGNMRFEAFLESEYPQIAWRFYAVDNCGALAASSDNTVNSPLSYQDLDVVEELLGSDWPKALEAPPVDVAVAFGFMHHIPGSERRVRFVRGLLDAVKPGGVVAVSFWRFMNSEQLAKKAEATHRQALAQLQFGSLEEGDYLLGWGDEQGAYRYCHNFSLEEIDALVASLGPTVEELDRFEADGRTGNLNEYVVLRRKPEKGLD